MECFYLHLFWQNRANMKSTFSVVTNPSRQGNRYMIFRLNGFKLVCFYLSSVMDTVGLQSDIQNTSEIRLQNTSHLKPTHFPKFLRYHVEV